LNAEKSSPAVSVILSTYNWPSVLYYAIQTVLWQTFEDFELLIIGDCCTDDTPKLVASFADRRIRWHNLRENSGNQSGPNNAGLKLARGRYVAYMHQDDLWLPDHLAALVDALKDNDVPLAHTLLLEVSAPPRQIRRIVGLPGSGRLGPDKVEIWTPAIMHPTAIGLEVGGWPDWRSIHDTPFRDFLGRVIGSGARLRSVPEMTVIKFHSGQRKNSYIDQPCAEQAVYLNRIRSEPEFRYRELMAAMNAAARGLVDRRTIANTPVGAPPGWEVDQLRQIRGLGSTALSRPRSDRYLLRFIKPSLGQVWRNRSTSFRRRASWMLHRAGRLLEP
jgi:glycosyltransferase involved in cell wall biosynthesis